MCLAGQTWRLCLALAATASFLAEGLPFRAKVLQSKDTCPMEFIPPGAHGMIIPSVRTFVKDFPDPWWDESHLQPFLEHWTNSTRMYELFPSNLEGCGVRATASIPSGTKIDLVWLPEDAWWLPSWLQ
eukprot:875844-Amphidinium_carterae.1